MDPFLGWNDDHVSAPVVDGAARRDCPRLTDLKRAAFRERGQVQRQAPDPLLEHGQTVLVVEGEPDDIHFLAFPDASRAPALPG